MIPFLLEYLLDIFRRPNRGCMLKDKRFILLIAFFLTQHSIAGDNPKLENNDGSKRIILPIHLLVDDDPPPASEPNVDYSIYKVGAMWPDWDWSGQEKRVMPLPAPPVLPTVKSPSSAPQKIPLVGCFAQLLMYFKCSS
jgi:hypothetical protein